MAPHPRWEFREAERCAEVDLPGTRVLKGSPEELVREMIQNSLDAREEQQVRVRFALGKIPREKIEPFLTELDPHLDSILEETDSKNLHKKGKWKFLAVEDFGTSGLTGDFGLKTVPPLGKSRWYDFWFRWGTSTKVREPKRGRCGIGRLAAALASKLYLIWGITVRIPPESPRTLLMGELIGRSHEANGKWYEGFGYFSLPGRLPIQDEHITRKFMQSFQLERGNRAGLSLVIPFPLDVITVDTLVASAIAQYFYPILSGELEVKIEDLRRGTTIILDRERLPDLARRCSYEETAWEHISPETLNELFEFARATLEENTKRVQLPKADKISENLFQNSDLDDLREKYSEGRPLGFIFSIDVTPKKGKSQRSEIVVYIQKASDTGQVFMLRQGLWIQNEPRKVRVPKGNWIIVLANDPVISNFLREAEGPKHLEWEVGRDLQARYEKARETLQRIRVVPRDLALLLSQPPQAVERSLLADIFPVGKGETILSPPPPPPPPPSPFSVSGEKGTIKICSSGKGKLPRTAKVWIAYRTLSSPFRAFEAHPEFDLSEEKFRFTAENCRIDGRSGNSFRISDMGKNFCVHVSGFDPHRDLVVKIEEEKT